MLNYTRNKKILFSFIGFVLILVILTATALTAITIYGGALQTSLPQQQAKADEYASIASTTPHGGVVFLGDSITEMYDLDKHFTGKGYINRGISSNETAQVLDRLQSNVMHIEPSTVVLLIGVNDIGHGISQDTLINNFTAICNNILHMENPPKLLVQSIYPTLRLDNLNSYFGTKSRTNQNILQVNTLILEVVNKLALLGHNIQYIDTHSILTDDDGCLIKDYTIEGLHINNDGYIAISKYLSSYI